MKLYTFDGSPTSRVVLLFCAESGIKFEKADIDLLAGEHLSDSYKSLNPCALVPMLEDGEFRLTESSAILRYLADSVDSPAYPKDLKQRAKIHEVMDWFNTGLYRVMGYEYIYPQIYAHHRRESDAVNRGTIQWGRARTLQCLRLLDEHWLGKKPYLCGNEITLADFFGAPLLGQFDLIGADLSCYVNISHWIDRMRKLKAWGEVHAMHNRYAASLSNREFVKL